MRARGLAAFCFSAALGCGSVDPAQAPQPKDLRINEVVSNNEGVYVDERGEADDYVELINVSDHTLRLSEYVLIDHSGANSLPSLELAPGELQVLWADEAPEQGRLHLGFRISAAGEELVLQKNTGEELDRVLVPPLADHHAYVRMPDGTGAFSDCSWASPNRENGSSCGPEPPPPPPPDLEFPPYTWAPHYPGASQPLVITEAALRPADFVEVKNTSSEAVDLSLYTLWLAPHASGVSWPLAGSGVELPLPKQKLAAGARVALSVRESATIELERDPEFYGVLTLYRASDGAPVDRADFSSWPKRAVLARPEPGGPLGFCANATRGEPNDDCASLASRDVGDHESGLLTPEDFHALAAGRGGVGAESVEFVVDLQSGDQVTFLNAGDWDLHYTFIREEIEHQPHLDRCDPAQRQEYNKGWVAFSQENYFVVEGRRYLLGTLVKYAGTELETMEFAPGDTISAEQMQHAFFTV
ncbi:MAG TPA: lamin tail domain-containing protein, partial [Polyangiaceae bacterium]|nr:lamin tail domain-containing protein [Polyangiaceae bacterium]